MVIIELDCETVHNGDQQFACWGVIYYLDRRLKNDEAAVLILQLYREFGKSFTSQLFGYYAILIQDKEKTLLIQSVLGSPVELFFTRSESACIISNRLRLILKRIAAPAPAGGAVQAEFLRFGFLAGSSTLIDHVNKVPIGTCVVIDERSNHIISYPIQWYTVPEYTQEEAVAAYPTLMHSVIRESLQDVPRPAVTLSAGFDSNWILWHAASDRSKTVDAFCVGGKLGRDEKTAARRCASVYENVSLHEGEVNSHTLEMLPDIVRRLEGTVFERGIFLQYVLAEKVHNAGCKTIMEGDGADQVMNIGFSFFSENRPADDLWHERPDLALRYLVLPKNLKMMESFHVDCDYAYLSPKILACLRGLKGLNGTTKAYHMNVVQEHVDSTIRSLLYNRGGTTHYAALFENEEICRRFCQGTEMPDLAGLRRLYHDRTIESILEGFVKKLYLDTFYRVFLTDREGIFDEN